MLIDEICSVRSKGKLEQLNKQALLVVLDDQSSTYEELLCKLHMATLGPCINASSVHIDLAKPKSKAPGLFLLSLAAGLAKIKDFYAA